MPKESEIISRIRSRAGASGRVLVPIGDDAAVISWAGGNHLIACCDLMVEGVHFKTEWGVPRLLGRKALAVTLSDVAAMGGTPLFAMISLAIPGSISAEFTDEVLAGIFDMAEQSGVSIIGGDTSSAPDSLFIDTSVIGECANGRAITRGGARAGDIIFVTDSLGGSSLGLSLLQQGFRLDDESKSEKGASRRRAIERHLAPEPRLKFGRALGEAALATAMIDISDGLSTDLSHILEESGCGAIIRAGAIPVAESVVRLRDAGLEISPLNLALHGGEEYELLFTISPENRESARELAIENGASITEIGEIISGEGLQIERDGALEDVRPLGYEHVI